MWLAEGLLPVTYPCCFPKYIRKRSHARGLGGEQLTANEPGRHQHVSESASSASQLTPLLSGKDEGPRTESDDRGLGFQTLTRCESNFYLLKINKKWKKASVFLQHVNLISSCVTSMKNLFFFFFLFLIRIACQPWHDLPLTFRNDTEIWMMLLK